MNEIAQIRDDANALIVIPSEADKALTLFTGEYDVTVAPLLANVKRAVDAYLVAPPDPKTEAGREAIGKFNHKLARSKTAFDDAGFVVNKTLKELPKKIDENRRIVKRLFEGWQEQVSAPKKAWEKAEEDRKRGHAEAIEAIISLGGMTEIHTAAELRDAIARVKLVPVDSSVCEEFQSEYAIARTNSLGRLTIALETREKHDADQAELVRLRAETAKRDAKDAEERAEREAKEQFATNRRSVIDLIRLDANVQFMSAAGIRRNIADVEANRLLPDHWGEFLDEAKRAVDETLLSLRASLEEAERKETEQETARVRERARVEAAEEETRQVEAERKREAAERKRLEDERNQEATARREQELRAADLDHRKKVNNEARDALALLMPGGGAKGNVDVATAVLTEIIRGKIPHVKLEY